MKTALLEETFELVRSLSSSEKRYFKLFSGFQHGDKSYLKLFDIIDRQKTFNEKSITQKFSKASSATNFPAVKKYLFDQLIASVKAYGAYKDLDSDHTDLIETYKVLHYKGLHGQSDRLLKKIKQQTLDDDAFARHFSVLLMEYHKEWYNHDDSSSGNIIRVLKERRNTLDIMDNYLWVGEIFSLARLHLRKKLYCRNKQDKEELTTIIAPLLKATESDMLSRTALGMRNVTLCDYYLATGQPKKAFETSKIYLELRKNAGGNDKLDLQTLNEYFQHIAICLRAGIFTNFQTKLTKYKELLDTVRNKEKFFVAYEKWINANLIFLNRTGRYQEAQVFIDREQKINGTFELQFSMRFKITYWYFMAYNLYCAKQYKKSLQFIQRLMNQHDDDIEEFTFARLLLMFIHYELKNYELLEYQTRSAQRYMEKKSRYYSCEKIMLDFFNSVSEGDTKKLRQEQLTILQKKVLIIFKSWYERGFEYYFDLRKWINSQISS